MSGLWEIFLCEWLDHVNIETIRIILPLVSVLRIAESLLHVLNLFLQSRILQIEVSEFFLYLLYEKKFGLTSLSSCYLTLREGTMIFNIRNLSIGSPNISTKNP